MTDNRSTIIDSSEVREITVTASLALADQWERKKRYAESITYRVETIRLTVSSDSPDDQRWTLVGRRVLKDGRVTDKVFDKLWASEPTDGPADVLVTMKDIVEGWRVLTS